MAEFAVKIEGLSKKYDLGGSHSLSISDWVRSLKSKNSSRKESFWALDNINLEVKQGEALGVIGKNGAGKSTLLKVLSKITYPTQGRFEMNGRVSSLLEVGTGFHPELSGRENIYLNGTILGMTRKEIKSRFDEIVDFSGVSKFLDTPVKHYSSGMYVRLAFSVAAHLEPEILIIDEVLAVGDAEFQNKCLGKMGEVTKEGRTVLFVSHNMTAIESICSRAILLNEGKLLKDATSKETISYYFGEFNQSLISESLESRVDRTGSGLIRMRNIRLSNLTLNLPEQVRSGDKVRFDFEYDCKDPELCKNVTVAFGVVPKFGSLLLRLASEDLRYQFRNIQTKGSFSCVIDKFPLASGRYSIGFMVKVNNEISDYIAGGNAFEFDVNDGDFFSSGYNSNHAPVLVDHQWQEI